MHKIKKCTDACMRMPGRWKEASEEKRIFMSSQSSQTKVCRRNGGRSCREAGRVGRWVGGRTQFK